MKTLLSLKDKSIKIHYVGTLDQKVIDLLHLNLSPSRIVLGSDKIEYIMKHKTKFESEQSFYYHIESIPNIISHPDYIGLHPNGDSIEYIKKIDEIMLVAVRVRTHGQLWVKSVFPITQDKLQKYIDSGTLKKFDSNIGEPQPLTLFEENDIIESNN